MGMFRSVLGKIKPVLGRFASVLGRSGACVGTFGSLVRRTGAEAGKLGATGLTITVIFGAKEGHLENKAR